MLVHCLPWGARNQEFEGKELQILKGEVPHQIDILGEVTAFTSSIGTMLLFFSRGTVGYRNTLASYRSMEPVSFWDTRVAIELHKTRDVR